MPPNPSASSTALIHLQHALTLARLSPPKPTNFRVGALLLAPSDPTTPDSPLRVLTTGYTLEHPPNAHAEQVCIAKAASLYACGEADLGLHLPVGTELVTTVEPCVRRSAGNTPCVERVLGLKREGGECAVKRVWVGVWEPETFVGTNEGRGRLREEGVEVVHVGGLEGEILEVATAGHVKEEEG